MVIAFEIGCKNTKIIEHSKKNTSRNIEYSRNMAYGNTFYLARNTTSAATPRWWIIKNSGLTTARAQMATATLQPPWTGGERTEQNEKDRPLRRKGKHRSRTGMGGAQGHARGWPRGGGGNGKTPTEHQRRKGGGGHEQRHIPEPQTDQTRQILKNLISDKCTQQYFTIVNRLYLQMYIMFTIVNFWWGALVRRNLQ